VHGGRALQACNLVLEMEFLSFEPRKFQGVGARVKGLLLELALQIRVPPFKFRKMLTL